MDQLAASILRGQGSILGRLDAIWYEYSPSYIRTDYPAIRALSWITRSILQDEESPLLLLVDSNYSYLVLSRLAIDNDIHPYATRD